MYNLFPSREGLGVGVVGSISQTISNNFSGKNLIRPLWFDLPFRIIYDWYYPPLNPLPRGEVYVFDCGTGTNFEVYG
ncbi:hypothetical protein CLV90_3461 [Maribacter spongiicola]|uniref:Uncharacterized protein n=1 Tax=Maribacter spongiicola TaxID=1206753 RepID=A0A4R7JQX6_9FLAO|nr:hypothetical protein CLV90_3461 [Maribacter spongiicola]